MAEGKNKIVVYADWLKNFDELTDEELGKLMRHFFEYVNDLNPILDDRLLKVAWKPIETTLKRDLKSWKEKSNKNRQSALLRWHKEDANACERTKRNAKNADSDSDSDSDSVNEILEEKEIVFNFRKSLIELGIEEKIVSDWLKVRSKKKAVNTEIAFDAIKIQIERSGLTANDCIKKSVENSWAGFKTEWLNNSKSFDHPSVLDEKERNYDKF